MKNIFYILSIISLMVVLNACEKDKGDTTKPVILLEAPANGDTLFIGHEVHFEVEFTDETELKSYKVDIHDNFDGHNHKSTADELEPWLFQQSWQIEAGKKNAHIHHHEIVVPETVNGLEIAPGPYHFMLYCTDAAGNESWTVTDVVVAHATDATAPVFSNISAPGAGQVFTNGQTITVTATVTDNQHLDGLFAAIMPEGATQSQANPVDCFAVMLHSHEAVHGKETYTFTASIQVGQTLDNNDPPKSLSWIPGNYYILLKSVDESGNIGFSENYPIVIQ